MRITGLFLVFISIFLMNCSSDEIHIQSVIIKSMPEVKIYITGTHVNLRSSPDLTSEIVGQLNIGDECVVIEKGKMQEINGISDYWYKISNRGTKAWIFGKYASRKQIISLEEEIEPDFIVSEIQSISGIFITIDKNAGNTFFVMKDNNHKVYSFRIVDAYKGEKYFKDKKAENYSGRKISIDWQKVKIDTGNEIINKLVSVEFTKD